MRARWLKKVPLPTILVGGIVIGITGKFPVLGVSANEMLSPLNSWLSQHSASPGIAMFFSGLLVAWLVYQIAILWLFGRRKRARIKLADLRDEGVRPRIEGERLLTAAGVDPWVERINWWDSRVVSAIAEIDEADSRQFTTLDFPGSARADPGGGYLTEAHAHNYIMHDVRLVRLDQRMTQYSVQSS